MRESRLIEGLIRKDRNAQHTLLKQYGDFVFAAVARMIPRTEDVEEVYQDVFMKVLNSIRTYNGSQASLRTWITRIAYNESVSFLRHRQPDTVSLEEVWDVADTVPESDMDVLFSTADEETVLRLESAIALLPAEDQALITMFYYDDLSLKDIAYVINSLPTTVASRLSRIRKRLYGIIKTAQR